MNYKESMAAATECGMSHEEASELVNEVTDISPEILMNKIQEYMGENVKSVFANIKQSLHSTNYIEDTLANMTRVFNVDFKPKFAGVTKLESKKHRLDLDSENLRDKNISRDDYYHILSDPVKNKVFYKPKEIDNLPNELKPKCIRHIKNISKWKDFSLISVSFVDKSGRKIKSNLIDMRKLLEYQSNTDNVHSLVA